MKANFRPGTARLTGKLLLASLVSAAIHPAYAQDQSQAAAEIDEIIVTGSRIARTEADASTPLAIIPAAEIKLSGAMTIDKVLNDQPQFVAATNGGATANTVPAGSAAGAAYVNLRGLGATRSLTLVNGRRFAIFGPEQVTDLNTIPTALIERTEVVTGGSSAVYGSDAITGVVNFIMKDDFEGVQINGQYGFDSATSTPTLSTDFTIGGNFADDRGNAVVSVNYYKREGFTRTERGDWATLNYSEACVTEASWSDSMIGVANGSSAANCAASGGRMGFIFTGSGDIPSGRFMIPGGIRSLPDVAGALGDAGLDGLNDDGFTFSGGEGSQRRVVRPADDFNLIRDNYLQVPQERWMLNAFTHYEFSPRATGYMEFHFSNNRVEQQLTEGNLGGNFFFNTDNPYLDADMQALLVELDAAETTPTTLSWGPISRTTTQNDGIAILNIGRRFTELPFRYNVDDHNVWRTVVGVKGDLGDASEKFLRNLSYDAYWSYARSEDTSRQQGSLSRSRLALGLLRNGAADPVVNVFGENIDAAGVAAIGIGATNITNAEQQVAVATLAGEAFDLPAGPVGFSVGVEWRNAEAEFIPDEYLRSGDVAGFNPGLPTSGDITSKEIFTEVRVPILAGIPLVQGLTANGGYRSSDYDLEGVGRVSTFLYGLDWRLNESYAFRGQFQRAIRAPNIGDLYGGSNLNFSGMTDPCSSRRPVAGRTPELRAICEAEGVPPLAVWTGGVQPNDVVPNLSGGNPNLEEETSDTRTFGFVFTPTFVQDLVVTIDYFDITLDNAIAQFGGGAQNTLNLCYLTFQDTNNPYCQAVTRDPNFGSITVPYQISVLQANIGGFETSGIDLNVRYGWDVGFGGLGEAGGSRFDISSAWTYTDEFTITPIQDTPEINSECVGAYGNSFCPGEPIPAFKGVTRLTWTTGPLALSLRHRFIDSVTTDRILVPERRGAAVPAAATFTNPKLDAYNYLDLSASWSFGDKAEVFAVVNNVLNEDPPIIAGFGGYGNTYPATYDYAGMTVSLGFNVSF